MANSTIISDFKENVVNAMVRDDALFYAIDPTDCEDKVDLIGTHIFNYSKNPEVITKQITFITVLVHTRKLEDRFGGTNQTFVIPTLDIWIYSHDEHMKMDPRITKDNRNDYISMLLDSMFNGSTEFGGIGKLLLSTNTEGIFNKDFLYRHMIFETKDLNNSLCESWC